MSDEVVKWPRVIADTNMKVQADGSVLTMTKHDGPPLEVQMPPKPEGWAATVRGRLIPDGSVVVTREYLERVAALLEPRYRKCEPCGMWRPNGRQVGPPRRHNDPCTYVETCTLLGVEPELV